MITTKRHAETIKDELWFKSKPWLIAGTGPSLDKYPNNSLENKYNIVSIYNAADYLLSDLYFCLDDTYWQYRTTNDYRYLVTRANNKIDYPENTLYIAVQNNEPIEGYDNYPSQTSTAQAMEYLHRCGVDTIYTIGVDGGYGITSSNISPAYRELNTRINFDDENKILYDRAKQLGVELIRL